MFPYLAIEAYRLFGRILPSRIRVPLKQYIDKSSVSWDKISELETSLAQTPYRVILNVNDWHQRWTYIKGHYPEPGITRLLGALNSGDIYIDVGANIGVHVLFAAHRVGESGQCIAFEPNPHNFNHLLEHISINGIKQIEVFHTALGNTTGEILMYGCNRQNVGSNLRPNSNDDPGYAVPIERADRFLAAIPATRAGICKIDVEGYEVQVLQGMVDFIDSHPNVDYIIEITESWLQTVGDSAQVIFDLFFQRKFDAYEIHPDQNPTEISGPLDRFQYDVLFSRNHIEFYL